jgi:hypothetical protein
MYSTARKSSVEDCITFYSLKIWVKGIWSSGKKSKRLWSPISPIVWDKVYGNLPARNNSGRETIQHYKCD